MDSQVIQKEIENIRTKLNMLTNEETTLTREDIVEESQVLDILIKKYYDCYLNRS